MRKTTLIAAASLLLLFGTAAAWGFDSTSDGSDGALALTTPGVVEFDPTSFVPPLDPDGDNVYHFTTITIGAGVTVRLSAAHLGGPVYWLATGAVQIEGVIDLDGAPGQVAGFSATLPALPGAGGFPGGAGGTVVSEAQDGGGPGGGGTNGGNHGSGAGHRAQGAGVTVTRGAAYGNEFLVPLVGGSGGAGGQFNGPGGGGGGAGGGAILIASSVSVTIDGTIHADGGDGGTGGLDGGGGSGGSIRVAAPTIAGTGALRADFGRNSFYIGAQGRVRLEAFQQLYTGTSNPQVVWRVPYDVLLPADPPPLVRVTTIDGVAVASPATGLFSVPDVTIGNAAAVTVALEAQYVPLGTTVELTFFSDNGATQTVTSTALAGTEALSTANASVTLSAGFTRGFARAVWTP